MSEKEKHNDLTNSKALFVMKIIAMSFAILAVVVFVTVSLTRWIMMINEKVKYSHSKIARATERLNKMRRTRIKHIMRQRKMMRKEERLKKKKGSKLDDGAAGQIEAFDSFIDEDDEADDSDAELGDLMLGDLDEGEML